MCMGAERVVGKAGRVSCPEVVGADGGELMMAGEAGDGFRGYSSVDKSLRRGYKWAARARQGVDRLVRVSGWPSCCEMNGFPSRKSNHLEASRGSQRDRSLAAGQVLPCLHLATS